MNIAQENSLFIELACQQKKLSPEAAFFCKERMENGLSPSVVALQEKFMTQEEVAHIYELISRQEGEQEGKKVYLVKEVQAQQDDFDERFLRHIQENQLLGKESLTFCQREQKRLQKMGYRVSLACVAWASDTLKKETILDIYRQLLGQEFPVCLVEGRYPFSETGLPKIRKLQIFKKKAKKEESALVMEQLEKVVQSVGRKKQGRRKATPEKSEEDLLDMEEEIVEEPRCVSSESVPRVESPALSLDFQQTDVSKALLGLVEMLGKLQQSIEQPIPVKKAVPAAHAEEEGEGEASEEGADRELQGMKKGKTLLTEERAIKIIQKGGALENCYVPSLKFPSGEISHALVMTDCLLENVDFSGVEFQGEAEFKGSCFVGKAIFKGSVFHKEAQFSNTVFRDGADFTKTEFRDDARFNTAIFKRFVTFNRARFDKKSVFTRSFFAKGVKFAEVDFSGSASFNDIGCEHRFYMEKCKFSEESTFSNARFSDIVDFSRSAFLKPIKFKGTNFEKWASFKSVKFEDECNFYGANIVGDLSFEWASFENLINLQTLCAERNVNFNNAKIGESATFSFLDAYLGRLFITRGQLENHLESHIQKDFKKARHEYGLLKNNFREVNEYDREDWAYLMEKRMERMSLKVKGVRSALNRFFNWSALDVACGYGTKPFNIFVTSFVVLLAFSLFYFILGSHFHPPSGSAGSTQLPALESLLVSFRTFTNASVGGWEANEESFMNYVMMLESFLGFFVMTVLVVTFSRKVIR